jgi:hypothetical protein
VQYTIPAGEHYSLENGLKKVEGKVMRFEVKFNQSAAYTTQKPENQFDINKLYGFSDCGAQHHVNSARVGWRWNGQEVELFAYCYANKVNKSVLLGKMKIDEAKTVAISVQSREYIFELDGKTVKMERHCDTETFQGYQLYPYFGGDETSPHEITILIRNLDTGGGKS